jgi:hypothetical protein
MLNISHLHEFVYERTENSEEIRQAPTYISFRHNFVNRNLHSQRTIHAL